MTAPLRVALLGAGTRAHRLYIPWLAAQPARQPARARAVAVLDIDTTAAQAAADLLPGTIAAAAADLGGVIADTCPDLVVIATPDDTHHRYAATALAADCSVLVEKPLAVTIDDAFALAHAAESSTGRLLVAHNLRFTNLHTRVHDILNGGALGEVVDAEFHYTLNPSHSASYFTRWHRQRAVSGGLEVTKASHHLDLLAWWIGQHPVAVTALLEHRHYQPGRDRVPADADIHDHIRALIRYDRGATACYTLTTNAEADGYHATLRGTEGHCDIDYDARHGPHTLRVNTADGNSCWNIQRESGTHAGADRRMLAALPAALARADRQSGFAAAIDAASAVATGITMHTAAHQHRQLPIPHPTGTREPQ